MFEISAKRAANLLGTIYLPNATLLARANNKLAEASAYTVVIAKNDRHRKRVGDGHQLRLRLVGGGRCRKDWLPPRTASCCRNIVAPLSTTIPYAGA